MTRHLKSILCSSILACSAYSQIVEVVPETDAEFERRMQWFTDAQFGLFIHYGVYSILGGEWEGEPIPKYAEWIQCYGEISPEEYVPNAAQFRPDKLDADTWVRRAKEAGMRYMVITTKHHDGFCLWDSSFTDYDLGEATDFNRDILGELKTACDKYGIKFGTYYSIIDWHHPTQRAELAKANPPMSDKAEYVTYMKGQLKELIDRYDPAIMWFDGDWAGWWSLGDGYDLYNYLRELSPELIINNRVAKRREFKKDYGTPEQFTPGAALDHVWEACWTVNQSWGFKKRDTNWKSTDVLVQKLIDINTKGGNLLLNVGPKPDGSWPEISIGQLEEMGVWNAEHEEAVYVTKFVGAPEQGWGRLAQGKASSPEEGELFAYVFEWPSDGKLRIRGVSAGTIGATTYGGRSLPAQVVEEDLVIDISSMNRWEHATVLRIPYEGGLSLAAVSNELELQGNELVLSLSAAELSGESLELVDRQLAVGWRGPSDYAKWMLEVPAPGKYTVKLLYGYEFRKKTEMTLRVGEQMLTSEVPPAGARANLKLLDVGVIEFEEVGTAPCSLRFAAMAGGAMMTLKTVYFVPLDE